MRALPEIDLGRFHDRFGQSGVGVDGEFEIGGVGAHLNRQHALGDQFAGAGADDTDAQICWLLCP